MLVNAEGLTLYSLSAERAGKFICTSNSCEGIWHPLTVKAGTTPTGAVGSLSVIKRPDGVTQVTYQGMPLYTFAQDHAAGETHGQGVKDVGTWSAVTATSGSSTAAPPSSSSAGESGGAKYAY
ncbi:MAG TPA: hypothetical protein VHT27_11790 [Solirubrobacteraceae bacterium]|nr:hypothetical protein [Solirubrobacteraceae bacterium]